MKIKEVIYEYESEDEANSHMKQMRVNNFYWVYSRVDRNELGEAVWIILYKSN